ncbi:type I-D CRISPR-associated helicase Cas3' [Nostoc sp. 'Peltigera membranacea cyanobiont' 232]|uniref:type I-D CRISPR-associated helicase Cas3' n=1 Tax=Nostoc sp. 'Peltigera membranacea cyanobiont' 232 TaxID=2014531 RepID=UPI000B954308|nr:type I-D CRISPR-associated helicase Cas3' [Nostoc sp. 'Peltigera membranacea cyanobiont' 232]OYE01506.1 type I-D CRISPR-associated helicase Cas3' [Nostoc sp. 'Peltigera membranacea cyanobiont' 232]
MSNQRLVIRLEPRSISACASLPDELSFMGNALQHQVDVFEQSKDADIILDLAPTGTGKTNAGLTVLKHQPNKSAVYIAPTNALIEQQTEAAKKFVNDANLPHIVKSASAKDIKSWSNDKVGSRSGEKLYNVLRNPATVFADVGANTPIILVTNPDIFYYATFFAYNNLDRGNIASSFYTKFSTVIFDEFHLYDAKQLVGMLFYLAYSQVFRFFENGRKVVLLTATPEPACELALQNLKQAGVKIARIDGEAGNTNLLPSQTAVNLELRPKPDSKEEWLAELAAEVVQRFRERPDENGAVILDSLDNINRLSDLLRQQGLGDDIGRITGPAPKKDRERAMQCQIILATSTVDVGFNFERHPEPKRQNLDWLIFSARDRAAFWQRIGRVGRVLGKSETNIDSEAIAYLPANAWEEGLTSLDTNGRRTALKDLLETLPCLDKPFLKAYWRSEAFLEIARPLLELEEMLEGLAEEKLILELFNTLKSIFEGNRTWDDYRYRMKLLRGAETIAKKTPKEIKKDWRYIKGGQAFVRTFIKAKFPEDWDDLQAGRTTLHEYVDLFKKDEDALAELKEFAEVFSTSYAPLFSFRSSLFESLSIRDPHGFILDESEETRLDPFHLLRYYEFVQNGDYIEVISRATETYQLSFELRYTDNWQEFISTELNKLTAFKNCRIIRTLGGGTRPTDQIQSLNRHLLPGVIICPRTNAAVIFQLNKQGIISYPINIVCNDMEKEYRFFSGLSGILTMAMKFKQLRLPDDEVFIAG